MLQIVDAVVATAAVVLGLSLIVQALQQIFKQWLELKAEYMMNELLTLFGDLPDEAPVLSGFYTARALRSDAQKKNPDPFAARLVNELERMVSGLGFRDLHLLETIDTPAFTEMLRSLPLAKETDEGLQRKFQSAVENAERWFEFTKRSFQEHYERRMKAWSFALAAVLVMVLNANLLDVYQEFSHDQTLREAAVAMADRWTGSGPDAIVVPSVGGTKDSTAASAVPDSVTAAKIRAEAALIRRIVDEGSFQVMGWTEARMLRYEEMPWYVRAFRFITGWVGMTLLVSLGAPFWYDLLKTVMGLKNSFSKN